MRTQRPSLAEQVHDLVERRLLEVHTSLPGRIVSYDPATQTADVQPEVRRVVVEDDGSEIIEDLPVLPGVRVAFPRFGSWVLTFPVAKGDHCEIRVASWPIDGWREKGRTAEPGMLRHHDLSDAWVVPGLVPDGAAMSVHADNLVLGHASGSTIHIKPGGEVHLGSENAADWVALATKVKAELDAIKADLEAVKLWGQAHPHVDPLSGSTGPPSTAAAYPAPHAPGSVAASKVKAD